MHIFSLRVMSSLFISACAFAVEAETGLETITVFAAVSTTETMKVVAKTYEQTHQLTVVCSFASSSTLAKQIEQGAPADVFLSADAKWMDYLAERQALAIGSRSDLLGNELVIIAPRGQSLAITPEKGFAIAAAFSGRLAIGDPTHVPAGIYTKEAFVRLGWWDALSERLAPMADVRAALKLVELGEADAGVVYATDAKASNKVSVVAVIPSALHQPIRYPLALTVTAKPAAQEFLTYLHSPAAMVVFSAAGFTIPGIIPKTTPLPDRLAR